MAELSFGARGLRGLMAVGIIFSAVTQAASESVTLSTYYPAPSGAYTQMITAGNAYLARDWGQVGIGTTGPGGKLDVRDSSLRQLLLLDSASGLNSILSAPSAAELGGNAYWDQTNWNLFNTGNGGSLVAATPGFIEFFTTPPAANPLAAFPERMRIDSSGNVGIGTVGPTQALEVNGGIKVDGNVVAANTIAKDNIVKAWCNFNGVTAGTHPCTQGFNVLSVTKLGTGNYNINWATPFANANYSISGTCSADSLTVTFFGLMAAPTTTTANVLCLAWTGAYRDPTVVTLIAIGQQ